MEDDQEWQKVSYPDIEPLHPDQLGAYCDNHTVLHLLQAAQPPLLDVGKCNASMQSIPFEVEVWNDDCRGRLRQRGQREIFCITSKRADLVLQDGWSPAKRLLGAEKKGERTIQELSDLN